MEKYTLFSDKKTGINPFIPTWTKKRNWTFRIARSLLLSPVILFRLVVGVLSLIAILLIEIMTQLMFVVSVKKFVRLVLIYPCCRILLNSFGIRNVRLNNIQDTLDQVTKDKQGAEQKLTAKDGAIVVCNFSSFVDIIYLYMNGCRCILFPCKDDASSKCHYRLCNIMESLMFSFQFRSMKKSKTGVYFNSLSEATNVAQEKKLSWMAFFPEGQKSNNTVILKWNQIDSADLNHLVDKELVSLLTFKYTQNSKDYGFPHTVNSALMHVFKIIVWCHWLTDPLRLFYLDPIALKTFRGENRNTEWLRNLHAKVTPSLILADIPGDALINFVSYSSQQKSSR